MPRNWEPSLRANHRCTRCSGLVDCPSRRASRASLSIGITPPSSIVGEAKPPNDSCPVPSARSVDQLLRTPSVRTIGIMQISGMLARMPAAGEAAPNCRILWDSATEGRLPMRSIERPFAKSAA